MFSCKIVSSSISSAALSPKIEGTSRDGRPLIRTTQMMLEAMDIVESIPDSHKVYTSLLTMERPDTSSDIKKRLVEEIEKAGQIVNGNTRADGKGWEEVIIEAESFSFFRGTIDFLYHNAEGKLDWSDFDTKLESAKKKFAGKEKNVEITDFAKHFQISSISFLNANARIYGFLTTGIHVAMSLLITFKEEIILHSVMFIK